MVDHCIESPQTKKSISPENPIFARPLCDIVGLLL